MMAKKNPNKRKHNQLYLDKDRRKQIDTSFGDVLKAALEAKDFGNTQKKKSKKVKSGANLNVKSISELKQDMEKKKFVSEKNTNNGPDGKEGLEKDIIEKLQDILWDAGDRRDPKVAKEVFDVLNKYVHKKNVGANRYMLDLEAVLSKRDRLAHKKVFLESFGTDDKNKIFENFGNKTAERKKFFELNDKYKKDKENSVLEKRLYDVIKRLYNKNLIFHGEKTGNGGLRKKTDIDGQAAELLLKLTGFFKDSKGNNISPTKTFVLNDQVAEKGLQFDSGGTVNGLSLKKSKNGSLFNSTVILDEHGDGSDLANEIKRPTSTTHIVFDILKRLGQVPKKYEKQMQRFVDFVDIIESNYYIVAGVDFENLHRTIAGLYRNLPIEYIYNYFKNPKNTGFEILSDEFMKSKNNIIKNQYNYKTGKKEDVSLKEISDYKLSRNKKAMEEFDELDRKNYYLKFNNSSFILDIGGKITDCQQIAAYNYRGSFRIFPNGEVYLYSIEGFPEKLGKYRTKGGHFLIEKMNKKELMSFINENFEFSVALKKQDKKDLLNQISELYENLEKEEKLKLKAEKAKKTNNMIKNAVKNNIENKISYVDENGKKINGTILTREQLTSKLPDGYVRIKSDDGEELDVERKSLAYNDTFKMEYVENLSGGKLGPKLKRKEVKKKTTK